MPPEFRAFEEDRILEAFKQQPPEFILFLDKDTLTEYKVGPFGEDPRYGRRIVEWIRVNYSSIETIQNEPLTDNQFEIEILHHRGAT